MSRPVKLTLRLDSELIEQTKRYASDHGTSLSKLVSSFFSDLLQSQEPASGGEFVRRLRARVPVAQVTEEDFWQALAAKHGPLTYE